jgi:large subunit ribosomal protein L31
MKKDTHPQYHTAAEITCTCGNVMKVGSVKEKMHVEICSACHPFFTGKEKIIDTAGRVEKFKAKQAAKKEAPAKKKGKK